MPLPKALRWLRRDWRVVAGFPSTRRKVTRRVAGFREVAEYRTEVDMNSGDTRDIVIARWVEYE